MRITSRVLDFDPLLVSVVAAGGALVMRPLQVAAPRAGLQRHRRRLVVGAAGALLPFRRPSLGNRHCCLSSVAELAFERLESPPPGIGHGGAGAGARVQVLATTRAEPATVLATLYEARDYQHQFFTYRLRHVHFDRVGRERVGIGIVFGVALLTEERADLRPDRRFHRHQTAAALPGD